MSEQEDLAPAQADTAIADTPPEASGGDTTEEINWQKRAEDAQAWATRAAQEASELRQWQEAVRTDPEAQRKFLNEELGYELEDDTPDTLDDDPVSALEQRLAAIEAKEQQATQQAEHDRQLQEAEAHFNSAFKTLGDGRGEPLTDEEQNAVIGLALTMPPGDDGMPPVEKAAQALEAIWETRQKAASEKAASATKRRPSHTFTPGGVAGEDKPDRSTHEGRVAAMLNKLSDTA